MEGERSGVVSLVVMVTVSLLSVVLEIGERGSERVSLSVNKGSSLGEGVGESPIVLEAVWDSSVVLGGVGESPIVLGGAGESPIVLGGVGESPIVLGGVGESPIVLGDDGESPIVLGGVGESPIVLGGVGESPLAMEAVGEFAIVLESVWDSSTSLEASGALLETALVWGDEVGEFDGAGGGATVVTSNWPWEVTAAGSVTVGDNWELCTVEGVLSLAFGGKISLLLCSKRSSLFALVLASWDDNGV